LKGAICLDTLGSGWSPVGTIKIALLSLRLLLEAPNPKDPQDAEVAKQMMEDPAGWALKAHEWAVKYAGAPRRELDLSRYAPEKKVVKDDPNRYMCSNCLLLPPLETRPVVIFNPSRLALSDRILDQHSEPLSSFRYAGYNKDLIDRFVNMGFELDSVVEAFTFVGIDRNVGRDYELEEAYMGDITARLLGEN